MKKAFLLVSAVYAFNSIYAQIKTEENKTEVFYPLSFAVSLSTIELSEKFPVNDNTSNSERTESVDGEKRTPIKFTHTAEDGAEWANDELSIQNQMGTRATTPPINDWQGQYGSGYPTDPSGAAGPNHYVQAVNHTLVKVFNKFTGANMAQFSLGTLWTPATPNAGDPIVMYDRFADRWFIAQFDYPPSNKIFIAVSKTPDPTGQFYTWTYNAGAFPDYLKFSIWHDGYYMTINQIRTAFCFERVAMLAGSPSARMVKANYTAPNGPSDPFASFCPLTGDADGQLPTSGPCPMIYPVDNGWGASGDGIYLKEITVNWAATPTMIFSTGSLIATNSHDMSGDPNGHDIPQPNGTLLDGIVGVGWFRNQWRQWAGYNTMLCVFGVKISATQRSVKWVELRQTGNTWAKYQEGVYSPDTKSRWVASIAMNDLGNIGMSYARSSAATGDFPSCAYTGRFKTDPLGQMTIAEALVPGGTGTSSQSANSRYGDYSHTTVDPVEGCVFWSTVEYLAGGAPKTRIWSYAVGTCSGTDVEGVDETLSEYNIYQSGNVLIVDANKLISNKETQVDLFDINGKLIVAKQITPVSNSINTSININGLASGAYLVRIGNFAFQKVVKVFVK